MTERLPIFQECGCCGEIHPLEFRGDCRDDSNRFTLDQIEDRYGEKGFLLFDEDGEPHGYGACNYKTLSEILGGSGPTL